MIEPTSETRETYDLVSADHHDLERIRERRRQRHRADHAFQRQRQRVRLHHDVQRQQRRPSPDPGLHGRLTLRCAATLAGAAHRHSSELQATPP
jgi:hypothetical protein